MKPTGTVLALLFVFSTRVALADPPPAHFTLQFDGDAAIWNPFDGFQACESFAGATLCLVLANVSCNGAGQCEGGAFAQFTGVLSGSGSGEFTGKAKCVSNDNPDDAICKASLVIPFLDGAVSSCDFSLENFKVNGPVDSSGFYHGKAKTRLCLDCGGGEDCGGVAGLFEYEVNPPSAWSLTVDVSEDPEHPKTYLGTAEDSLGFSYTAKGKYKVKKDSDATALTLTGVPEKVDPESVSQGALVKLKNLVCDSGGCQAGNAKIKVQGNKSQVELAP